MSEYNAKAFDNKEQNPSGSRITFHNGGSIVYDTSTILQVVENVEAVIEEVIEVAKEVEAVVEVVAEKATEIVNEIEEIVSDDAPIGPPDVSEEEWTKAMELFEKRTNKSK